jgi:hypothetical protein
VFALTTTAIPIKRRNAIDGVNHSFHFGKRLSLIVTLLATASDNDPTYRCT